MGRKTFSTMHLPLGRGFIFFVYWMVQSSLLIAGCAQQSLVAMEQVTLPKSRVFPDFVAVIAQPEDTFSSLALEYLGDPSMDFIISEFNNVNSLSPGQEVIIPLKPYQKGGLTVAGYQTVPVLCYHKFSRTEADQVTVTGSVFEEQMRFLKEQGFRVITLDELFDFFDFNRQIPRKSVVITIDDGWRSTYEIAYPILRKYGYPATLFVYTDMIVGSHSTLSYDLIREMSENSIDIQCHTRTHRNLGKKTDLESFRKYFGAIEKELTLSREIIKRKLDKDVEYLAYPYGETNRLVIALLIKLGYRGGFTIERNSNAFFVNPYRVSRSMIYGHLGLEDFANNLTTFVSKPLR